MKLTKFLPLSFALLTSGLCSLAAGAPSPQNPQEDPTYSAMWRAVLDFGKTSVSRPQLLAEFQAVLTNYPNSQYEQRARQTVEILTRMIAEDEAHAKAAPANLGRLPVEDRVHELIFQLREQNGQQFSQPGWCDIFNDPRGTNTAAHQLVNVGFPAVPQLIAALEDPTFTRSVGFWRNFAFSHTVLTVGDCAVAILQRIAGKAFYQPASTSGYMSNESKNAATRKAVEAWWAEFQKEGEEQMLIKGTEAGDGNAPAQAELLIGRYPNAALASLIKGTQTATDDWVKTRLVQLFEKFDSPEALAFLDQEMRKGASSPSVAAAAILSHKGRPEAITVMIHEWEKSPNTGPENMHGPNELVRFLASVDSPEAIVALGRNLQDCPLNARMAVVETVGEGGSWWYGHSSATNRSTATQEAAEKLLVTALQDTGQVMGESGSRMGKNYTDPRVCDMAGFFLNQLWPERYNFDLAASLKARDSQRVECQNVWRRAHNQALLSPPSPARHVSTNEAANVTAIEWDADSVKPSDAFAARIEALRDKPLAGMNVVNLLTTYSANPEPGTSGLIFQARRDEDLTGARISICLLKGAAQNPKDDWEFAESVVLGQRAIDGRFGGVWANETRSWESLASSIENAVASPPETPFVVNVRLASKAH
jgi:hypothetical protein